MNRAIVVLGPDGGLPPGAVPALRAAERVFADDTVDPATRAELGAEPQPPAQAYSPREREVLFTCDAEHPLAPHADRVIAHAPAGAALLDAVAVMDRLRSPGGCPWDAEQTHTSLLQYLVEECYELYQAVEDSDRVALREELGDVLLQVLFHARVAAEDPDAPFGIDEVAADLVAKLVGRHPHVFAGTERIDTAERQESRWEELKRAEKQRTSSVDGVAFAQPAVALAAKLVSRTARAGLPADLLPDAVGPAGDPSGLDDGVALFGLAARAKLAGHDPEAQLRTVAVRFAEEVRRAERAAAAVGQDPHALDAEAWRRAWTAHPGRA